MNESNVETLAKVIALKVVTLNNQYAPELDITEFLERIEQDLKLEEDLKLDGTDPILGDDSMVEDNFLYSFAGYEQEVDLGSEYDQMAYDMPF